MSSGAVSYSSLCSELENCVHMTRRPPKGGTEELEMCFVSRSTWTITCKRSILWMTRKKFLSIALFEEARSPELSHRTCLQHVWSCSSIVCLASTLGEKKKCTNSARHREVWELESRAETSYRLGRIFCPTSLRPDKKLDNLRWYRTNKALIKNLRQREESRAGKVEWRCDRRRRQTWSALERGSARARGKGQAA